MSDLFSNQRLAIGIAAVSRWSETPIGRSNYRKWLTSANIAGFTDFGMPAWPILTYRAFVRDLTMNLYVTKPTG